MVRKTGEVLLAQGLDNPLQRAEVALVSTTLELASCERLPSGIVVLP